MSVLGGAVAAGTVGFVQLYTQRGMEALAHLATMAAGEAGVETLLERLASKPAPAALLADAALAVARTDYEIKIEAISAAISEGVLYEEGTTFDTEALIVRTIIALERPHIVLLMAADGEFVSAEEMASRFPAYGEVLPSLINEINGLGLSSALNEVAPGEYAVGAGLALTPLGRAVRDRFLAGRQEADGSTTP